MRDRSGTLPCPLGLRGLGLAQYPGSGLPLHATSAPQDQWRVPFSIGLSIRLFGWLGTLRRRCTNVPARRT